MPEILEKRQSSDAALLVDNAKKAQSIYARYTQAQVDEVVTAVAWTIMDQVTNRRLSEQAVAQTGLGRVEDKITKNFRKTLGLLRDLQRAKSIGVIAKYPQKGLIEIARPVGVVAAVVPSTNPIATPYNKTLNALKGGNAVILAPSPKGEPVCCEVVKLMQAALKQVGAPVDLVQKLPAPIKKDTTMELMELADLVVITGSQNNVRAGAQSGTPAIGVGAGNVAVIIDETADIKAAADKIIDSKTFDNATSCSSENALVICKSVYEDMLAELKDRGAFLLGELETVQLQKAMWSNGKLSPAVTAKSADTILEFAQIAHNQPARIILVPVDAPDVGNPFCNEKLSPVLTVFCATDFQDAMQIVKAIYAINGAGHSVGVHSANDQHVLSLGLQLPVCRVIVNQAHCFATGGAFDNGLPFSLSMGCGTWGGNVVSDNVNYRHYINTTRISRVIEPDMPSLQDLFGSYWQKYNIQGRES